VVEHSLGKGEVDSSILSGSTSPRFSSPDYLPGAPIGGGAAPNE
jgi:hypothetical protein